MQWASSQETGSIQYSIERSNDEGAHFISIGTVAGKASGMNEANYQFQDPQSLNGAVLYRIRINDQVYHAYSKIILLSSQDIPLALSGLLNPFYHSVSFNLTAPEDHNVTLSLYDSYGRLLTRESRTAYKGLNHFDLNHPGSLQTGMYVLQVQYGDQMITKQLIKAVDR